MKNQRLQKIALISVMSAVSTVIYLIFPEIPLVPGVDYLKLDFSDIPAIVAAFTAGPLSGICVEVVKNALHLFRTTTFGIGEIMNICIGSSMIASIWLFSKLFAKLFKKDNIHPLTYYAAGICTVIVTIFSGWLCNAIFTPIFFMIMGIPVTSAAVMAGVWGSTLLNVIKAAFNILPFYPLYFAVNRYFSRIK